MINFNMVKEGEGWTGDGRVVGGEIIGGDCWVVGGGQEVRMDGGQLEDDLLISWDCYKMKMKG